MKPNATLLKRGGKPGSNNLEFDWHTSLVHKVGAEKGTETSEYSWRTD